MTVAERPESPLELAPGEVRPAHVSEAEVAALLPFCTSLPKAELHAHINGCVRPSTLRELASSCGDLRLKEEVTTLLHDGERSLAECFALFAVIHRLTTRHDLVERVTQEVVDDFAADGVLYCELRTTPKRLLSEGITKVSYVDAVLRGVDAAVCGPNGGNGTGPITIRLLLSIDRREGAEDALETVQLAASLRSRGVVGVDLSGNPTLGEWSTWAPALAEARRLGLAVTLHCGEVPAPSEVAAMLAFRPGRLGHAVTVAADGGLLPALLASRVPVELCLSSNVLSRSVASYGAHHFGELAAAGHPLVLCTDDTVVFNTSLSREFALAAVAFRLPPRQLWRFAAAGVVHSFAEAGVKATLLARIEARRRAADGTRGINDI